MNDLLIVGAGGHAKVVISAARAAGLRPLAVLDANPALWGTSFCGLPVRGADTELERDPTPAVLAIGDNAVRESLASRYAGHAFATIVHPRAWLDPSVSLGAGTVVFAGAVLQPECRIGAHVIVNTSASVDHDATIEDFAQIAPGAHLGGNVRMGRGSFAGIGCSMHQGAELGAYAVLGGGAFPKGTLADGVIAVGVPARSLDER